MSGQNYERAEELANGKSMACACAHMCVRVRACAMTIALDVSCVVCCAQHGLIHLSSQGGFVWIFVKGYFKLAQNINTQLLQEWRLWIITHYWTPLTM